ncbi:MAG: DUF3488 domain-containing protein [Candidatus Schekmanbacteria bacterium]|nr:DUF3488 domain-containing protein [Candidatus Schekmanbacteria bacterium]
MGLNKSLNITTYLMVLCSLSALAIAEKSWLLFIVSVGILILSLFRPVNKATASIHNANPIVLIIVCLIMASTDYAVISGSILLSLSHFLLLYLLLLLFKPEIGRQYWSICLISFMNLLVAASVSDNFYFSICFILYLLAAVFTLIQFKILSDIRINFKFIPSSIKSRFNLYDLTPEILVKTNPRRLRIIDRFFLASTLFVLTFTFIFTISFFLIFPRIGLGFMMSKFGTAEKISGFSEQTQIGDIGKILENPKIVLRAIISPRIPASQLRWRGLAYDLYKDNRWHRSSILNRSYRPIVYNNTVFKPNLTSNKGEIIQQTISLEAIDSEVIFALYPVISLSNLSGNIKGIFNDSSLSLFTPWPHYYFLSYKAESSSDGVMHVTLSKQERAAYTDTKHIDSRIKELAINITSGINDDYSKVKSIEDYLRKKMRYTRDLHRISNSTDPLYEFIFLSKEGHCEYFATALTLMLRSVGIPARYVNGFYGGEWNDYGEYYIVRQEDAHSWVEAYIENQGWAVFDATPSLPDSNPSSYFLSSLLMFLDSIKMAWSNYVVDYDLKMQINAATGMSIKMNESYKNIRSYLNDFLGQAVSTIKSLFYILDTSYATPFKLLIFIVSLLIIILFLYFIAASVRKNKTTVSDVSFYNKLVSIFEKQGYKKKPYMTGYDFFESLEGINPHVKEKARIIINWFYKLKYGQVQISKTEIAEIEGLLKEISKSV